MFRNQWDCCLGKGSEVTQVAKSYCPWEAEHNAGVCWRFGLDYWEWQSIDKEEEKNLGKKTNRERYSKKEKIKDCYFDCSPDKKGELP